LGCRDTVKSARATLRPEPEILNTADVIAVGREALRVVDAEVAKVRNDL